MEDEVGGGRQGPAHWGVPLATAKKLVYILIDMEYPWRGSHREVK